MLESFDKIMEQRLEFIPEFVQAWLEYHFLFEDWKVKDTEKILDFMFDHFVQLEKLRESVQGEPDVNAQWNPQIDAQQKLITEKVTRIGGKSALTRFLNLQSEMREMSESSDAEVMHGSPGRQLDSVRNSKYEVQDAVEPAAKDVSLNQVFQEYGSMASNEKLAHELIMNPDFELNSSDKVSFEHQIKEIAKKAFFDKLRGDFQNNDFSSVGGLVGDIRQVTYFIH